jgi:hypothetical protein
MVMTLFSVGESALYLNQLLIKVTVKKVFDRGDDLGFAIDPSEPFYDVEWNGGLSGCIVAQSELDKIE